MNKLKTLFNNEFGKDVIVTAIGQVGVLLLTFLVNKMVSIYLGPDLYTYYSITIKSASFVAYVAVLGLGIALPRFIPRYIAKNDKVGEARTFLASVILMFTVTVVIFLLMIIFQEFAARVIYGDISYKYFILPLMLYAVYIALATFLYAYYRALNKFYFFNISQIIVQSLILITVFISRSNLILLIYLVGIIISVLILIFILIYTRKYIKLAEIKNNEDLNKHIKELFTFCIPRVPGELFLFALVTVPLIILKQKIGDTSTTGFAISITINTMVTSLFSFIGMVLLPYVSKNVTKGEFRDVKTKVNSLGVIYVILSVLGILGIYLLTPFVIRILYSSSYIIYQDTVQIISLAILPNAIYLLLRNPLDAVTKKPFNTINLGISFIAFILMLFFFKTETMYAYSFVITYSILGFLSILSWIWVIKRKKKIGDKEID